MSWYFKNALLRTILIVWIFDHFTPNTQEEKKPLSLPAEHINGACKTSKCWPNLICNHFLSHSNQRKTISIQNLYFQFDKIKRLAPNVTLHCLCIQQNTKLSPILSHVMDSHQIRTTIIYIYINMNITIAIVMLSKCPFRFAPLCPKLSLWSFWIICIECKMKSISNCFVRFLNR
jgi:hypothetical protein